MALKSLIRNVFHAAGGLALTRRMRADGVRILTFHRFPRAHSENLTAHCRYLRENYMPVALSAAVAALYGEISLPPQAVAVTIDDGYQDIAQVAGPIFREYAIPATVFLATGFIDRWTWLWVDQVRYVLTNSRQATTSLAGATYPLATPAQREAAIAAWKEQAKAWSEAERLDALSALPVEHRIEFPVACPPDIAPLSWDEVRSLRQHGFEFGAHTVTHPILSRLPNYVTLHREIAGSKQRIDEELKQDTAVFCYPNGRAVDISEDTRHVVREAGFRAAVTTMSGRSFRGDDPYLLRRISVDASDTPRYFRERVAELA